MFAPVIEAKPNRRVIAVSDIHGDDALFARLLDTVGYCEDDTLVIVGDILERGRENLKVLRRVMELSRRDHVYVLLGNNDALYEQFFRMGSSNGDIITYHTHRQNSLLREMCAELHITMQMDARDIRREIERHFAAELDWLCDRPVILDTPHCTFVHAGLGEGSLFEQNRQACIKTDAFLQHANRFDRFVAVGHWPATLYCQEMLCCNPMIDRAKNIIAMDGGNQIKSFGQVNAVIFPEPSSAEPIFMSCDGLPTGIVAATQQGSADSYAIVWGRNEVQVLSSNTGFTQCRHIESGRTVRVPDSFVYGQEGKTFISDYSDYVLPLEAGETVSIVGHWNDEWLVKKNGVVGWYTGEIQRIQ